MLQTHVAQGLVDCGFLIVTFLLIDQDFMQSGTNLSGDQSPPPITFPALLTPIRILFFVFKIRIYVRLISNSADALEAL